jgi:hypothetical protein
MRGVKRSFGATMALKGVELSVVPGASWTAVASEARHRFWPGTFVGQNVLSPAKAPSLLRFAGAVQDGFVSTIARPTTRTLSQNRTE